MKKRIYANSDVEIFENHGKYIIVYDLGDHAGTIREDEISKSEAESIINSGSSYPEGFIRGLMRRLGL